MATAFVDHTVLGQKWVDVGQPLLSDFTIRNIADGGQYLLLPNNWKIYQSPGASSAYLLGAAVFDMWQGLGGRNGVLGAPTGDINQGSGFQWQNFQQGVIYSSAATGAHAILGNPGDPNTFWGRFAASGYQNGLGLPTGDVNQGSGFQWQAFQNGAIYWSAGTGAHEMHGRILAKYTSLGGAARLGLPTSDVIALPDEAGEIPLGRMQTFERGTLTDGSVDLIGDTLVILGAHGDLAGGAPPATHYRIEQEGDQLVVHLDFWDGIQEFPNYVWKGPAAQVRQITFYDNGGNDTVTNHSSIPYQVIPGGLS